MDVYILFSFSPREVQWRLRHIRLSDRTSKLKEAAKSSTPHHVKAQPQKRAVTMEEGVCSPAVQLLHLLDGVRPLKDLWGRGSCRPLPCRGSVYMIHVEDPAVAVNASLPV